MVDYSSESKLNLRQGRIDYYSNLYNQYTRLYTQIVALSATYSMFYIGANIILAIVQLMVLYLLSLPVLLDVSSFSVLAQLMMRTMVAFVVLLIAFLLNNFWRRTTQENTYIMKIRFAILKRTESKLLHMIEMEDEDGLLSQEWESIGEMSVINEPYSAIASKTFSFSFMILHAVLASIIVVSLSIQLSLGA